MSQKLEQTIPANLQPQKAEKGALFKNKLLEKVTRAPIGVPVTMHILIVIGFLYYAFIYSHISYLSIILLFLLGILSWTFIEYAVHRWVYHCHTNLKWLLKIQHVGHGIHHQHPRDPERLAMPPLPALILISLFFGLFWLIGGSYAQAFFPGFLLGYVLYISMHYAQHRYRAPKFGPLKKLWKYHALHHYKYPETKAFGVSTTLWDHIFGTIPK
ncbi:sterol desaturase family protein [Fulvivirgaceae bacterium BMA10]|uniref:Sterol desaturase family protein n=1 Tax=Splendidivirga corallicola TaxID=3051826 RepID=A0ABT8KK02_9BACT|nr:sterol desaturase family protein [Fulvivirgaceae bacterium BMA10]